MFTKIISDIDFEKLCKVINYPYGTTRHGSYLYFYTGDGKNVFPVDILGNSISLYTNMERKDYYEIRTAENKISPLNLKSGKYLIDIKEGNVLFNYQEERIDFTYFSGKHPARIYEYYILLGEDGNKRIPVLLKGGAENLHLLGLCGLLKNSASFTRVKNPVNFGSELVAGILQLDKRIASLNTVPDTVKLLDYVNPQKIRDVLFENETCISGLKSIVSNIKEREKETLPTLSQILNGKAKIPGRQDSVNIVCDIQEIGGIKITNSEIVFGGIVYIYLDKNIITEEDLRKIETEYPLVDNIFIQILSNEEDESNVLPQGM